ncbi:NAD(P)H-quinone oxidoreductase subunit H [compost metagenome]
MLRASGIKWDLRRIDAYSAYPEIDFDIPVGKGEMGTVGDCWDRYKIRVDEVKESVKIIEQCLERLIKDFPRTDTFDPRALVPKKVNLKAQDYYVRAENPKGELGFYFVTQEKSDIPKRVKARGPSFNNLSVLPELGKGTLIADLIAILGSMDIVLGEVDR